MLSGMSYLVIKACIGVTVGVLAPTWYFVHDDKKVENKRMDAKGKTILGRRLRLTVRG